MVPTISCAVLITAFLSNVCASGLEDHDHSEVNSVELSKRSQIIQQQKYNEEYNNSHLIIDKQQKLIHIFGRSVKSKGNILAVTNFDYNTNTSRGSINVFDLVEGNVRSDFKGAQVLLNSTWQVHVPLQNRKRDNEWEDFGSDGEFGQCLSFNKHYMLVGGNPAGGLGKVYIFNMLTDSYGVLELPDGTEGDNFAHSVDINTESDIVVGANGRKNIRNVSVGEAYLFRYKNKWKPETLHPDHMSTRPGEFGSAVAITDKFIVIGDPGRAKVFVYYKRYNEWNLNYYDILEAVEPQGRFGCSFDVHKDNAMIVVGAHNESSGAGKVHVYSHTGDVNWKHKASMGGRNDGEQFGISVSLNERTMAVAASRCDNHTMHWSGCVYQFDVIKTLNDDVSVSTPQVKLMANDTMVGDEFALNVAVHGDWVVLSKYKLKVPYYCRGRRECDTHDYGTEVKALIAIIICIIFIALFKLTCL